MHNPQPSEPATDTRALDRYEVKAELNPRYLEHYHMCDYYGVYHVVAYHADGTRELLFTGIAGQGRYDAYELVGKLTAAAGATGA
jgi:hypothetical protein